MSGRRGARARPGSPGASRQGSKRRPSRQRKTSRRTSGSRSGRRRGTGRALLALLALLVGATLLGLGGLLAWSFLPASAAREAPIEFDVASGDRPRTIERLAEADLLDSPALMRWYVRLLAPNVDFRPRPHLLAPGLSPRQLVQRLGEIGDREVGRLTIPEGYDRWQIGARLEEAGICSKRAFLLAASDRQLLQSLGIAGDSAEGYLFPATYDLRLDEAPRRVVKRLCREAGRRLDRVFTQSPPHADLRQLGFSRRDVVTLASLVEKETGASSERSRIARVFLNRLLRPQAETKGLLQSDPTAAYGCRLHPTLPSCAAYAGKVTPGMLRDPRNPYNTYTRRGLPPGPICNPGEAALVAVLSPARGDELFFVADGKGTHTFSEDYETHKKAVQELRRRQQ